MSNLVHAVETAGQPQYGVILLHDAAFPVEENLMVPDGAEIAAGRYSLTIRAARVGWHSTVRMELWGGPPPAEESGWSVAEATLPVRAGEEGPAALVLHALTLGEYGDRLELPAPGSYRVRALTRPDEARIQVWRSKTV
ncbi:hypothetical protein AB0N09_35685 [Streptomyces erythrochromogenes]|uniref:hypothetical protein n=1 Tax=Streptomyces erythrochromogenes TaxID=285574 RepID=UPI003428E8C0